MRAAPSAKSMDVFSLRDAVVRDYAKFATSFTTIHADDIRRQVEKIYAENRYWPEPLLQINPNYKRTTTVADLVTVGRGLGTCLIWPPLLCPTVNPRRREAW